MNGPIRDAGWMYHNPRPNIQKSERVHALSRVPGLTNVVTKEPAVRQRQIFTYDSPHVRRAKMNGSPTLLCNVTKPRITKEPKPYKRCSWYYVADNLARQRDNTEPPPKHTFTVPSYMCDYSTTNNCNVHQYRKYCGCEVNCVRRFKPHKECVKVKKPRFTEFITDYRTSEQGNPRVVLGKDAFKMKKQPVRKGFEFPHDTVVNYNEPRNMYAVLGNGYAGEYHKYRKLYNHINEANKLLSRCAVPKQ